MLDPGSVVGGINAVKLILDPNGVRGNIVNWRQVATAVLRRLDHEISARPTDEVLRRLRDEVQEFPGVADLSNNPELPSADDLLVPLHYRIDGRDLELFSTIATIGEAHDVTLEELRLETFFAADEQTESILRSNRSQPR